MRRSTLLSLALAACLALVVSVRMTAEPTKVKVDGKIIKGYIAYLSADEQQGRRTLTPGYEKMAEWAAGKFKEWGLAPAGENGLEAKGTFKLPAGTKAVATITLTGKPAISARFEIR